MNTFETQPGDDTDAATPSYVQLELNLNSIRTQSIIAVHSIRTQFTQFELIRFTPHTVTVPNSNSIEHFCTATAQAISFDRNGNINHDTLNVLDLGIDDDHSQPPRKTSLRKCSCQFDNNARVPCRHQLAVYQRMAWQSIIQGAVSPFWRNQATAPEPPARQVPGSDLHSLLERPDERLSRLLSASTVVCEAASKHKWASHALDTLLSEFARVTLRRLPPATVLAALPPGSVPAHKPRRETSLVAAPRNKNKRKKQGRHQPADGAPTTKVSKRQSREFQAARKATDSAANSW